MNTLGSKSIANEKGAILIVTVLVLAVVSAVGVMATRSATTEVRIAAHDKAHKMTWFFTDGIVSELSSILIEKNVETRGFGEEGDELPIAVEGASPNLEIYTRDFYLNAESDVCEANVPSPENRDVAMASSGLGGGTSVQLRIFSASGFTAGTALEMVEGYSGRGKSAAGGGLTYEYTIRGLGQGPINSEARITARYRLII